MAEKRNEAATELKSAASGTGRYLRELMEVMVLALIMALVINTFVVKMFYIPSSSMENTLLINDKLIVNRVVYFIKKPQRGDIIVFKSPKDTTFDYVKRCVALAGDEVEMKEETLYVNGEPFSERPGVKYNPSRPYMKEILGNFKPYVVPEGCLFMMGDNRYNSQDSRFWGPLPVEFVKGKAVAIYWPPRRIQLLD
ncbi:MAG: signal peptidase I [bacterium]|nr:signal peptidase I [bacterium]